MFRHVSREDMPRLIDINRELAISTYDRDAGDIMGLIHKIFCVTKASLVQKCPCDRSSFLDMMPRCPTWPGLEEWVAQVVACGRHRYMELSLETPEDFNDYFCFLMESLWWAIKDTSIVSPEPRAHPKFWIDLEYLRWEGTVDIPEVLGLISWFVGTSGILNTLPNRLHYSSKFGNLVGKAMAYAEDLGLCLQRVWSLGSVAPGRELGLLGLLPVIPTNEVGRSCWQDRRHSTCTADYCSQSALNFTSVEQLHLCPDPSVCKLTDGLFSQDLLLEALAPLEKDPDRFVPTAWALDGKSVIKEEQPFMAVSHVWSDGTGAGTGSTGNVNECLWQFFTQIARELKCDGIWWDTVCLPASKKARIQALNTMEANYANAKATVIHDRYLSTFKWTDPASACFAVVMSTWFTRGWTALELQKSRKHAVYVVFSENERTVLKNLDTDVLLTRGHISYRYHQMASGLIRKLREPVEVLNDLLTALGPRYTSWSRDKAIIAGLFVGIKAPASKSQVEIYQEILKTLQSEARHGTVSRDNLHHGVTTMKGGSFNWCPPDLFQMPTGDGFNELHVQENGDLLGLWQIRCLIRYAACISVPDATHPLIRSKLFVALAEPNKHVLLLESDTPDLDRAIVAKVRNTKEEVAANKYDRGTPLPCEFIGSVVFRSNNFHEAHRAVYTRIGDPQDLVDLRPDEKACYIGTFKSTIQPVCVCWQATTIPSWTLRSYQ
jgi:hypothetical protein